MLTCLWSLLKDTLIQTDVYCSKAFINTMTHYSFHHHLFYFQMYPAYAFKWLVFTNVCGVYMHMFIIIPLFVFIPLWYILIMMTMMISHLLLVMHVRYLSWTLLILILVFDHCRLQYLTVHYLISSIVVKVRSTQHVEEILSSINAMKEQSSLELYSWQHA